MQPKTTTPLHTPRMRRLGPGLWCVESKTQPGVGHQCTVDACSCPAGKRHKLCWHRRLVRRAEAWLAGYDTPAPLIVATPVPMEPVVPVVPVVPVTAQGTAETGMRALQVAFE